MLQRTLASLVLLTLLFAQAVDGLCQLSCDHQASTKTPACHGMVMENEQPSVQAEAPCPTPSCPAGQALSLTTQALQPDLSTHVIDQPSAIASRTDESQLATATNSPPDLTRIDHPRPPALPRLTSLRI